MPKVSIGQLAQNIPINSGLTIYMFLIALLSNITSAYATQSLEKIQQQGIQFVYKHLISKGYTAEGFKIELYPPDSRLKLANCRQTIQYYFPENAKLNGNSTLGVKCPSPIWNIYLPLRIKKQAKVWVAQHTFKRGDSISRSALTLETRVLSGYKKPLDSSFKAFTGLKTTHAVRSGTIISQNDICLVCKGDKVALQFKSNGLTVKMDGISLQNGIAGENISIRNSSSKKIVTGKVQSAGIIEMNL